MTLPDRAETQAVGRPLLQRALDSQGVPVQVVRAGSPSVDLIALFVPVTPDGKRAVKVTDPEYAQETTKFFFRHDADAVRAAGFNLVKGGRVYTPTSPAVDVADQGVALMLVAQPLPDRTRVSQLTFTLPGSGLVRDPKTGNMVPAPGPQITVPVRLVASDDPRIRDMVGADVASVALIGRWGSFERPMLKPAGLNWGSTSPLILDGQVGVLTLKLAYPDPDLVQEQQLGARFVASWKAGV